MFCAGPHHTKTKLVDQSFQEKLKSQVGKVLAQLAIRWEGSCHTAGPCFKVFDLRNAVKIDNVSRWKPEKEVEPDRSFYYLRMCPAALQATKCSGFDHKRYKNGEWNS